MKNYLITTPNFYIDAENENEAYDKAIMAISEYTIFLDITENS